jgi:leucine dehydrogenase
VRHILYAPDIVINAGGMINVYNELNGYNRDRALLMTRHSYYNLTRIFEVAGEQNIHPHQSAKQVAVERVE